MSHFGVEFAPLTITFIEDESNLKIHNTETLKRKKITCLIGKAGQGKTTLLRKLYLNHLNLGKTIPILIFLRKIDFDRKQTVPEVVSEEFSSIGIDIGTSDWSYILQSGRTTIYWDGFDEVPDKWRVQAVNLIEDSWMKYNCPCIVTTRPETEITRSSGCISNAILCDLNKDDVFAIIEKTVEDNDEYIDALKSAINDSSELTKTLISPIIVDIFIHTYRSLKVDPKSVSDFYEDLFICLASQHDKIKTFKREHKSELTVHQLEDVFCYVSFRLIRDDAALFSDSKLRKLFSNSCEKLNYHNHNHSSHIDVINLTNLISPDGHRQYSYIHKSIMEYYAAKFIANSSEELKKKFYTLIIEKPVSNYINVLFFLYQIDNQSYLRYFAQELINRSNNILNFRAEDIISEITGAKEIIFTLRSDFKIKISYNKPEKLSALQVLLESMRPGSLTSLRNKSNKILYNDDYESHEYYEKLLINSSFHGVFSEAGLRFFDIVSKNENDETKISFSIKKHIDLVREIPRNMTRDVEKNFIEIFNAINTEIKESLSKEERKLDLLDSIDEL